MKKIITAITVLAVLLTAAGLQAAVYTVPGQFASIQAAIDAAGAGDTVQIAAGAYRESTAPSADLMINKSLNLVGAGSSSTIIELSENNGNGLEIKGANLSVTVQGIRFTRRAESQFASNYVLRVGETASSFSSLVFRDVEIAYARHTGIVLERAGSFNNVAVENCNIHHSGSRGFYTEGTISGLNVANSGFNYCGVVQPSLGIGMDLAGVSSNIAVSDCSFNYNKKSGVNVSRVRNAAFTRATAFANTDFGFSLQELLGTSSNVRFLTCSASSNGMDGIYLSTQSAANTISGVEISGCLINSNRRWGVGVVESTGAGAVSGVAITGSNIVGNQVSGLFVNSRNIVNARNNWWGSVDGPRGAAPGSGDRIGSNLDFIPFLTKPTGQNLLWVGVSPQEIFVKSGDTVAVTLNQSGLTKAGAGYQAFLSYNTNKLTIAPENITLIPAESPYSRQILKRVDNSSIDLAAGIDNTTGQTASQNDAKLAELTFLVPPGTSEGATQITFRQSNPPTRMSDTEGDEISGWIVDSPSIIIDNTPPTVPTINLNPAGWTKSNTVTITFGASDIPSAGVWSSIDYYTLSIDGGAPFRVVSPYILDTSSLSAGIHPVVIRAFDRAGNSSSASTSIQIDRIAPVISIDSAKQDNQELISTGTAIQGQVEIFVSASDAHSGFGGTKPSVTVTAGTVIEDITSTGVSTAPGIWKYIWQVTSATPNGTVKINASIEDIAQNTGTAAFKTFSVNKNQAYVTVELQGVYAPGVTRSIRFTLGGSNGTLTHSITKQVAFTSNGTSDARGTVSLTNIPDTGNWTCISAKDEQHTLRSTVQLTGTVDRQYSASFVGVDKLVGGDLNNDQIVDIKDFGIFSSQFGSRYAGPYNWPARDADISDDGGVDSADLSFIQISFKKISDPECGGAESSADPQSSVSVSSLEAEGVNEANEADLNNDGVVDEADVQLFIQKYIQVKRGR